MRRVVVGAVASALATFTLAACTTAKENGSQTGSVAQAGAPAASPTTITVHGKDFAFTAPDTVTAGMVTFHFTNDGPGFHHMQLVRLDSGKTVADFEKAMSGPPSGPPARWMTFVTGPNAPNPGAETNATFDLTAGNYAIVCLVDIPNGVPHFTKGMVKALTVVASSAASAPAPKADATITLADYAFQLSGDITAGQHTFEVKNSAMQPHEIEIVKLAPGKTAQDFLKWMGKMAGPPPASAVGGVSATSANMPVYFTASFDKGNYAMFCFLPDAKDGKPHFMHGMIHTFSVM